MRKEGITMKKFLSILLALLMLCSMSVTGFAAEGTTEAQRLNNEVEANEQYQRLLHNLSEDANSSVGRSASLDFYGGAYINDDGNLVVCVTDDYDVKSAAVQTYTGNDQIIIERVKYTYEALEQEQSRITEVYEAMRVASATKEAEPSKSLVNLSARIPVSSCCVGIALCKFNKILIREKLLEQSNFICCQIFDLYNNYVFFFVNISATD